MRKRGIAGILVLAVMAGTLLGCGKKEEISTTTAAAETTAAKTKAIVLETQASTEAATEAESEEFAKRVEVDGKIRSYLTGLMVDIAKANRRPVAVMMSNDKAALPQYGINHADVVYEAPVEGDMNRYMAIFEDYDDLERIGSVRSCRTYYTYFAKEYDAIYAHYGQSTFAVPYLKKIDNINGIDGTGGNAFYRTKDRKSPHNAYTSGEKLNKMISTLGYRTSYSDDYSGHFTFTAKNDLYVPDAADATDAIKFYPSYTMNNPWFEYHADDGKYYRFQYGAKHNGDEGQIAVNNVIFQYVEWGHYATTEYLNINVHSGGAGYFFTGGKCQPISWKKDGEYGPTRYYDSNGKEVTLNKGKTWICIIGADRFDKAEIYGK